MPAPYRLDDEKFELFMEAGRLKMEEEGLEPNTENFIITLQEWFHILTDEPTVAAYVAGMTAAKKAVQKAELKAALAELEN